MGMVGEHSKRKVGRSVVTVGGARDSGRFDKAVNAARDILTRVLADYRGKVAVTLWNGERVVGDAGAPCNVVFRHPTVLRHLILHRDLVRLAESYLAGEVEVEGDMESLFDLVEYLHGHPLVRSMRLGTLWPVLRLSHKASIGALRQVRASRSARRNSRASIAHHYDVGNDFYRLWLDPEMVYSCAYFRDAGQSLAAAQRDKLDYICRKLRLAPGQTLLDIGCGWGALVCWAARNYGVRAHGITLSEQQYHYAVERVRNEGLPGQVTIELRDYRELPEGVRYDKVVSVGMFEHIGVANFPVYFGTVKRVLKPGGLFLNHGITNDTGWQDTPITRFMNRYVFPDGELARISDVSNAMEQAGFEIIDVEGLRRHYALTLRRWLRALEFHREQAVDSVGETAYRVWRLYMAGSAYYFDEGSTNVYQVLAGHARQPLATPLRRDDIYERGSERGEQEESK
ncbi:MAG: class I SAM-dependent methyltransferase [Gammaproteobacteria bacterium]|nr:class I SAM-dependent methyltransferase [Gammaproteobacteria bacterium]